MTQRLPIVGGDDGDWGTILNGFLEVSLSSTGTLNSGVVADTQVASNASINPTKIAGTAEVQSNKNQPSGYAGLNSSTQVPLALLPANIPLSNLSISGTASSSTYLRGDGTWASAPSAPVSSVFGRTGGVVATSGDYTYSQVGAAQGLVPTAVKTSAYSANPGDFVPVNTTSGNVTITLPTTPADKSVVGVKLVILGTGNTVTVNTGGSDVINKAGGSTSASLSLLSQGITWQYQLSTGIWYVLGDDIPLSQTDARYLLSNGVVVSGTPSPNQVLTASSGIAAGWSTPAANGISRSVNVVSTATNAGSAALTDYVYLVSGTTTVTLPTAVSNTNLYTVKNTGANVVSISTTSSQTIDGSAAPITLPTANDSLTLVSNGTNWNII